MTLISGIISGGQLSATRDASGRITEVKQSGLVVNVASTSLDTWMTEVYSQLPITGSTITIGSTTLNLEDTTVTVADRAAATVELVYRFQERNGGSALTNALSMSSSLQMVQESKDPENPSKPLAVNYNEELIAGSIEVYAPQDTLDVVLYEQVQNPRSIAKQWTRKINEFTWLGDEPGTWMCTGVAATPANLNATPLPEWRMTYTFQYDETGWQPELVVKDPETGEVYPDVTIPILPALIGNGARRVIRYESLDFSTKF